MSQEETNLIVANLVTKFTELESRVVELEEVLLFEAEAGFEGERDEWIEECRERSAQKRRES